uniref:Hyaluronan-mediated motility receptor C-terminal domain-containing protein n=1 Tax=Oncorhynchus kisutch TaxID=8019 RepID=A0A8C7JI69_ONCKI
MSFSRAPVKRFNENIGCAPAPGTYELKPGEVKGPASFLRSERFKLLKATPSILPPSPSKDVPTSPVAVRRTMSVDGLVSWCSHNNHIIRSLVQQRGEQDRRLVTLEEELRKVEAKLLSVVREKTGLAANVTTLERQLAELKKTNDFLKNKVSADTTKKRFQSMSMELMEARNKLDVKDKELSFLQISTGGQVMLLETDLEAARATLATLRERNEDLADLHHDTKVHNEELENEMGTLQAVIQELREEVNVLQGYLDTANDHIQDLRMKLREKTEMENSMSESQREKLGRLEQKLEQCTAELRISQNILHQKEEESEKGQQDLQASRDALQETEKLLEWREAELTSSQKALGDMETQMQRANQEMSDSQSAVRQQDAEVVRLREVLRRTVKEMDERIAHLGEKCKILEEERSKQMHTGRVEELTAELSLLQENWRSEKEVQEQLAQAHTSLTEELKKEKVSASLASGLERVREETEDERKQLEDELEEALVELSVLELQEERREEEEKRREEALQSFQQEKTVMERGPEILLEVQTRLAQRDDEMKRAEEEVQRQLQEERMEKGEVQRLLQQAREEKEELQRLFKQDKEGVQRLLEQEKGEGEVQGMSEEVGGARETGRGGEANSSVLGRGGGEGETDDTETEHWRRQYEELYAKVKPFQEQLNGFAAERESLLNKNGANQEELTRLADAYARLLGHQNQKQKIRHVVKLKDENISLKQELSKLRAQVSRQKKGGQPQRRVDPSKAFNNQDSKENQQPAATPLRHTSISFSG